MSVKTKNGGLKKNSNQPQHQKPFDVVMNEELLHYCNWNTPLGMMITENLKTPNRTFVVQNWFIPIVKNQEMIDEITQFPRYGEHQKLGEGFEKVVGSTKLLIQMNDKGDKIESVFVLINKGGKLYKVVSWKDYGVVKSRMERSDSGRLVPYGKCDLVPFEGKYEEYVLKSEGKWRGSYEYLSKDYQYVDGKPNGECFDFFKSERGYRDIGIDEFSDSGYPNNFQLTTYKMGKKNGFYLNTKSELKGDYLNGKKNGEWIEKIGGWDTRTINYVNGVKSGEWSSTHGEKGFYRNDLMDGEYTKKNSDCFIEGTYKLGKKVGLWTLVEESYRNGYTGDVLTDLIFKDDGSVVRIKYTQETFPQEYVYVIKSEISKRVDFIRDFSKPLYKNEGDKNEPKLMIPVEVSSRVSKEELTLFDLQEDRGWSSSVSIGNENLWDNWGFYGEETIKKYNYPHYEKVDNGWGCEVKLLLPKGEDGNNMDDYSVSIPRVHRSNEVGIETIIDGKWVKSDIKTSKGYEDSKEYEDYTQQIVQKHLDGLSELYISQQKEKEEELKKENPMYKVELSSFPMD